MKLIFISDNGRHHKKINLNPILLGLVLLLLAASILALSLNKEDKRSVVSVSERQFLNKLDSMLIKTAKLEAQVKRLNSLGKIIADKNEIDIQAYLLSQAPAMGGLAKDTNDVKSQKISLVTQQTLSDRISDLELELELEEQRYDILNKPKAMFSSITKASSTKAVSNFEKYTMPVSLGYLSSPFGKRRDPFNGRQRHHNGIDIAAKHGSKIHTIASGFVTFAGRKGAYGNVIDIHHSDSLKSRYAHLNSIDVKKGDVVRKGDIIATLGQTGRATGPHLHLEVWDKDKPVNPEAYIDTAIIK